MTMGTKLKRSNDVVWEELGSEVLLVNPASGARWLLNAAAAAAWRLCDGTRSAAELARSSSAGAEVAAFCGSFQRLGLLQPAGGAGHAFASDSHMSCEGAPSFRVLNLGAGGRRRPNPAVSAARRDGWVIRNASPAVAYYGHSTMSGFVQCRRNWAMESGVACSISSSTKARGDALRITVE